MKIAVTATKADLDAAVDAGFGRCACFLIVETKSMDFESVKNPNATLAGGAGIQSARLILEKGAEVVLTGNCGPNAFETLAAGGIDVVTGCSGKVREVIEAIRAGRVSPTGQPNVPGHFGTSGGPGGGQRRGRGAGVGPGAAAPQAPAGEQDLEWLKQQSKALARQLEQIQARIRQLEREGPQGR